jgi:membrane fusion protein, multidrug efflux system
MVNSNQNRSEGPRNFGQARAGFRLGLNRHAKIAFYILIPLIIITVATNYYLNVRPYITTNDAFVDGEKVAISAKFTGRIKQLDAKEGDTVNQDQLLVQLADSDLQAQQHQAEANLNFAQSSVSLAKINVQHAQDDFDRSKQQFDDSLITKEQYDHSKSNLELAQAQKDVSVAQAGVAEAQVNLVKTQLKTTKIKSPLKGIVAKKWVSVGDVVQSGQPIYSIYDPGKIWISAYFEETKVSFIKPGDRVEINVNAYPNKRIYGKIESINIAAASEFDLMPAANASGNFTKVTQRIPVKISVNQMKTTANEYTNLLLPGMSVEVKVKIK